MGRREIPGIEPGRHIRLHGRVTAGRAGPRHLQPALRICWSTSGGGSGWRAIAGDEFSDAKAAVGGTRGIIESTAPGVVFVTAYLVWGGFKAPTLAAVGVIVVAVIARLVQRHPVLQALSGTFGVLVGAAWAWVAGAPEGYFVPGLVTNAVTFVVLVASILVRRPLVGFFVAALRQASLALWLRDRALLRRDVPLLPGSWRRCSRSSSRSRCRCTTRTQVAALGVAKLAMGIPLFVLIAWAIWLMVRNEELPRAPEDPPQPTR